MNRDEIPDTPCRECPGVDRRGDRADIASYADRNVGRANVFSPGENDTGRF